MHLDSKTQQVDNASLLASLYIFYQCCSLYIVFAAGRLQLPGDVDASFSVFEDDSFRLVFIL